MHIEFLLEERSAESALTHLLPKLLPPEVTWQLHPHLGKPDLLGKLPARLRGYSKWIPHDTRDIRIVVLVDEDREDCLDLKATLEAIAANVGFYTRSTTPRGGTTRVVNRIAVEELEAWFFGDPMALRIAFPRVKDGFHRSRSYRDPDSIEGGTWEALGRLLKRAGYYPGGFPKIEVARRIAEHMQPRENQSRSFGAFRSALEFLTEPQGSAANDVN